MISLRVLSGAKLKCISASSCVIPKRTNSLACQYLPLVGQTLLGMGWERNQIEEAIDFSGIEVCLRMLGEHGIHVRVDGSISHEVLQGGFISACSMLWGQSRKMHHNILQELEIEQERQLRLLLVHEKRQ